MDPIFKCVVLLKKRPWHVFAIDEEEACKICEKYGDLIVGVFSSDSDIVYKEVKAKVSLSTPEIKQIEPEDSRVQIFQEIAEELEPVPPRLTDNSDTSSKDN